MKKTIERINYKYISNYNKRLVYLADLYKSHGQDPMVAKIIEHDYVTGRKKATNRY